MKKIFFLIIVGVVTILAATSMPANALQFGLDVEYTGGAEPAGDKPWLTATFVNIAGGVQLTMDASGLTGDEFVSGWYFNWDFKLDNLLSGEFVASLSTGPSPLGVSLSDDGFDAEKAGGSRGHGFDIFFNFPTSNSDNGIYRFGAGEKVVYEILGTGLDAGDFEEKNKAGYGEFYSAAHVQGIDTKDFLASLEEEDDGSGWIGATSPIAAIPEPATILLIGAGLFSLLGIRRKKIIKST